MPFGSIFNPRRPKRDFFHRSCQSGKQVQTPQLVLCRQTGPPDQFLSQVLSPQFDDFPLKPAAPPSNDSGLSTPGAQDGISFVEAPVSPGNATEVRTVNYPVWSPYFLGSSMYVVIRVLRKSDQVARLFCVPYNPSTVCTMYVGQA